MNQVSKTIQDINTIQNDSFARVSDNANDSTGRRSLVSFLNNVDKFGIQTRCNFEVEFSAFDGITFFVQSIEFPGSKQNTCDVFYDGIKITIPVIYDNEHEFSMTIINDMQGYIYTALKSYIEIDSYNRNTLPSNTLTIHCLTGQISGSKTRLIGDKNVIAYQGSIIKAKGVRFTAISGLSFGQSSTEIQTFTINGTFIEYVHMPLNMDKLINY